MTFLELVQKYFPREQWGNALAVIYGESRGNPGAVNNTAYADKPGYKKPGSGASPEYSVGLFQINTLAWPRQAREYNLLDPEQNVRVAKIIYDLFGWRPWSAARALGITSGRNYTVSESPIANKPVPGTGTEVRPGVPAPGAPSETPTEGSTDTSLAGQLQEISDFFNWVGVNAGTLILRATLMGMGSVVMLIGLYFLMRSL